MQVKIIMKIVNLYERGVAANVREGKGRPGAGGERECGSQQGEHRREKGSTGDWRPARECGDRQREASEGDSIGSIIQLRR